MLAVAGQNQAGSEGQDKAQCTMAKDIAHAGMTAKASDSVEGSACGGCPVTGKAAMAKAHGASCCPDSWVKADLASAEGEAESRSFGSMACAYHVISAKHGGEQPASLKVVDYSTVDANERSWVDASEAFYVVGAEVDGYACPMQPTVLSFANEQSASQWQQQHGGEVHSFSNTMDFLGNNWNQLNAMKADGSAYDSCPAMASAHCADKGSCGDKDSCDYEAKAASGECCGTCGGGCADMAKASKDCGPGGCSGKGTKSKAAVEADNA